MDAITLEIYYNDNLIGTNQVTMMTPLVDIANGIKTYLDGTPQHLNSFLCAFSTHHWERAAGPVARMPTPDIPVIDVLVPNDLYIDSYRVFTINDVIFLTAIPEIADKYPNAFRLVSNIKIRVDLRKTRCGLTKYTQNAYKLTH